QVRDGERAEDRAGFESLQGGTPTPDLLSTSVDTAAHGEFPWWPAVSTPGRTLRRHVATAAPGQVRGHGPIGRPPAFGRSSWTMGRSKTLRPHGHQPPNERERASLVGGHGGVKYGNGSGEIRRISVQVWQDAC